MLFAVELTRANASWIYAKGEPYRVIAALELYATLLCILVFGGEWKARKAGSVTLSRVTDNLGNAFCLTRLMSSKFPS